MEDVHSVVSDLSKDGDFIEAMKLQPLIMDYKPCKSTYTFIFLYVIPNIHKTYLSSPVT